MKAALAIFALVLILVGRFFTYRASRAAWQIAGTESTMEKLKAHPELKSRYRFGQIQYLFGVVLFAACFFI